MRKRLYRSAWLGVFASFSVLMSGVSADAVTLADAYYGGISTYGGMTGDVIENPGTHYFEISSAVITRPTSNTLSIIINTNFAGVPGTPAADGTGYGSLFLTPGANAWNPTGGGGPSYPNDTYTPNQWQYAFRMLQNPGSGSIGPTSSGLYAIGGGATAVAFPANPSVPQSYSTANGTVVMSNVGGDPVTYPGAAHPGFYFRQGQAVQYTPTNPSATVAGTSGTWSVDAALGEIIFSIVDNGLFGNTFALAWAMTCANDVIQGQVTIPELTRLESTPLPAAFSLFAGGLGVIGLLSRRRKKTPVHAA